MRPFEGVKILDCTHVLAGPFAAYQLAVLGADVIKVEDPNEPDQSRESGADMALNKKRMGTGFITQGSNKRSIALNLKTKEGQEALKRLVKDWADVFIENYRPDVKYRLGIGPDDLRAINPRLVYASISGFGQDGPYANWPGFDSIAQGMGGLMSLTGRPEDGPMRVGIPIADLCSGHFCAQAIMAALLEREVSGEGQWVQTSLLESQIAMLDFQAAQWLIDRKVPKSTGNEHPLTVPTGVFETSDGYLNLAAIGQTMWKRLCEALDLLPLVQEPGFGSDPERVQNRARVNAAIGAAFKTRSTADWTERLLKLGVPCGPIYSVDHMFEDPQVRHLGIARPMHHPELGDIELVGLPMNFSRYPRNDGPLKPAPNQGDQTDAILTGLGYTPERIAQLRTQCVV